MFITIILNVTPETISKLKIAEKALVENPDATNAMIWLEKDGNFS
jgi:hypothetical protein